MFQEKPKSFGTLAIASDYPLFFISLVNAIVAIPYETTLEKSIARCTELRSSNKAQRKSTKVDRDQGEDRKWGEAV